MNQHYLGKTGALAAILGLWLGSCGGGFDSPAGLSPETGTLTVRLSRADAADPAARTLAPPALSGQYVRLAFAPDSGEAEPVEAETDQESFAVRLAPGTWNIRALGWQSKGDYETAPDLPILKGWGQVTVLEDAVENTRILLYPLGTGTGTLSYAITVPGDTVSALLRVYALPATADSPSYLLDLFAGRESAGDGTLSLAGELDLAGGFYRAALDISRGAEGMLRKNDTVHIYDGLSTPAAYEFTAEDFSPANTFDTLEALQTYMTGAAPNTPDTPYLITLTMPLGSLGRDGDSLRGLFAALNGRYAALDLRPCAVGETTTITGTTGTAANPRNGQYVVSLFLPEGITAMGSYALYTCSSLEYLILPDTLTAIGNSALRGIGVRSLSIPGGVESLGDSAFEGAARLERLDLSGLALKTLGTRVFVSCSGLKEVILPATLPGKTLPATSFWNCTALTSVSLPQDTESIGNEAFSNCPSLAIATLPPSLKTVGQRAFQGCSKFTADIGSLTALETIGNAGFKDCVELRTLRLPESLATLDTAAFQGCISLALVEIPEDLVSLITRNTFVSCRNIQFKVGDREPSPLLIKDRVLLAYPSAQGTVVLPEGIEEIVQACFTGESGITGITLPASLKTIGNSVFNSCVNLASVSFPADSQLQRLGLQSFYNTKIAAITLPASLTAIEGQVFYGCASLAEVAMQAATPPSLGDTVFTNTASTLTIYVPDTSVDTYKATNGWKDVATLIAGLGSKPGANP
jgi:hypothetical protein